MKKSMFLTVISAFLFMGCAIGFGRHGNLVIVPALPVTVEVDSDQYYYQRFSPRSKKLNFAAL